MAKETLSQRHKRYREIFGMNEELKNPYLDFGELVAAIRSSFIAERFDESSLVIVPRDEKGWCSYSTKPLTRNGVAGKGRPEFEEFRIHLKHYYDRLSGLTYIDMMDGYSMPTDILITDIPKFIKALMLLMKEFDEAGRIAAVKKAYASKPQLHEFAPDGIGALLEKILAGTHLMYDYYLDRTKLCLELYIRLPYKKSAFFSFPLSSNEDDIKEAVQVSKDLLTLMSKCKGRLEVTGYHYTYHVWKNPE